MAKSNFQVKGFEDARKILDALPKKVGPKVVQQVLREGAKPLIEEAKIQAPNDVTGNLKRSIGVINARGRARGSGVYVGPRRGRAKNAQGYHAHLVEYGTGPRKVKDKKVMKGKGGEFFGTEVGPMPAHPFLRPAWEVKNQEVLKKIGEGFKSILLSDFKNVKF